MDELGCSCWKIRGCSTVKATARIWGWMRRSVGVTGNVWDEGHGAGAGTREFGFLGNGNTENSGSAAEAGMGRVGVCASLRTDGKMNSEPPVGLGVSL